MDIDAIKSLKTIAETGSFSAAAERLNLTQPAVSKRISKLEDDLNCSVLERDGRRAKLTLAGKLLLEQTALPIQQLETVKHDIAALNDEISGELNIVTSHHIGMRRLPVVLKAFCDQYPSVKIHLSFADSEAAYQQISDGHEDFGVVTLGQRDYPNLITEPLWNDPLTVMVSKNHTLAQLNTVSLEELSKEQAVLPGMETYTGRIVKRLFDKEGLQLKANMATNYLETIKMMVSVGLGWTMLPASMVDENITPLTIEGLQAARTLGILQRQSYRPTPAAKAFLSLLRQP